MSELIDHALTQLEDFRTRSRALRVLEQAGGAAESKVLQALRDAGSDNIRWCLIQLLGTVGGKAALDHLQAQQYDVALGGVAVDSAKRIRARLGIAEPLPEGQLGAALAAAAPAATRSVAPQMDPGSLMRGVCRPDLWAMEENNGAFHITVPLAGGRKQVVDVSFDRKDDDDQPVVELLTVCGPLESRYVKSLLRFSARINYIAAGLRKFDDADRVILIRHIPRAAGTEEVLRKAVADLAVHGDSIEKALQEEDLN